MIKLLSLDEPEPFRLAAECLGKYDNYKWLDFGNSVQQVSPAALKMMAQRGLHVIRVYTAEDGATLAGVVGLANVDPKFRAASVWAVLGKKRHGGCTTPAVSRMLTLGFDELGLRSISAWTTETNIAAQRVLRALNFRYVGRMRRCHYVDGHPLDRLVFDLLASEHRDIEARGTDR